MPSHPTLYTVGHSTHPWSDFLRILNSHGIRRLADVRRYPGSRRWPWFSAENMRQSLPLASIDYVPMPSLGGRRKASPDSPNEGWRSEAFRGYADYMLTPEFQSALDALVEVAKEKPTAIMCSEAVPWRCHRSLIADAMLARGWTVWDIFSADEKRPHKLPDFARVESGGKLWYPGTGLFTA